MRSPLPPDGSALIILWVIFLDLCLKAGNQDTGYGGRRDLGPTPTSPTPTGDAADLWVRNQRSQDEEPSLLASTRS